MPAPDRTSALRRTLAATWLLGMLASPALALEGGTGAYLLGSRDSFAGIVPGPGSYVTNSFIFLNGQAPDLSLGGQPVVAPQVDVFINKLDITHVFDADLWGGTPGVTVTLPFSDGSLSGDVSTPVGTFPVTDNDGGFGDLVVTPMLGWHAGMFHYSVSLSVFAPTGEYDSATIDIARRSADNILNFGKNRWAAVPAINATWFDPGTGREISGSLGITFSARNRATDWQTAPELNVEFAAVQHLKNGFAFGAAGYAYQQLGEDSGEGPARYRQIFGARSLKARVYGIGPLISYQTRVGGVPVTLKAKYTPEFGGKRRFESDVLWLSVNMSF